MSTWNKNLPQSSEFISNWPAESQGNNDALEDALSREHTFPGTYGANAGVHRAATTAVTGTMQIATAAECQTGTNNTKAVTPLGLTAGVSTAGNTAFGKLKVFNNVATPASNIDIVAHSAVLVGSTESVRAMNVSVTVNCTTVGANGLDAGSLGTHWYYFYIIAKADGTVAGLASLSATAPTMPTDYIYKLLVSSIYYNATIFILIRQLNRQVYILGGSTLMFSGGGASWISCDCSAFIPSNAVTAKITATDITGANIVVKIAWDNSGTNTLQYGAAAIYNVSANQSKQFLLNPSAPQTIYVYGSASAFYLMEYELDI